MIFIVRSMSFSKRDWEKLIRKIAENEGKVFISEHAELRMRQRNITRVVALEVLRKGNINQEPEPDLKTGDMKCALERYVAGHAVKIVVAVEDSNATTCLIVTAFAIGG